MLSVVYNSSLEGFDLTLDFKDERECKLYTHKVEKSYVCSCIVSRFDPNITLFIRIDMDKKDMKGCESPKLAFTKEDFVKVDDLVFKQCIAIENKIARGDPILRLMLIQYYVMPFWCEYVMRFISSYNKIKEWDTLCDTLFTLVQYISQTFTSKYLEICEGLERAVKREKSDILSSKVKNNRSGYKDCSNKLCKNNKFGRSNCDIKDDRSVKRKK